MGTCNVDLGGNSIQVYEDSQELHGGNYDPDELLRIYNEQGFVVIRSAISREQCESTNSFFDSQIKPSTDFFKRQVTGLQPHTYTSEGFMKEALMSIQDLPVRQYGKFRSHFLDAITCDAVRNTIATVLGQDGSVVYTMYFEGNQQTPAHRDAHTIDAEESGRMVGVWIAAQDINPGAGRFFLLEGSHAASTPPELMLDRISPNDTEYFHKMTQWVYDSGARVVAPVMRAGDVILFHSRTIHGSLPTTSKSFSRRSFTCHYIPRGQGVTWFRQSDAWEINRSSMKFVHKNGVPIMLHGYKPVSQARMWANSVTMLVRSRLDRSKRILVARLGTRFASRL